MQDERREPLAYLSHEIWSSWMRWMFNVGTFNEDGTWTMSASLVARWQRQMNTRYTSLPENERDSDREQADKILAMIADPVYSAQFIMEHYEMIDQLNTGGISA